MITALRFAAATALALVAGSSAQAQLRLPQVARTAQPTVVQRPSAPPKPAALSPAQLSTAVAKTAPALPPPDLAQTAHLTWEAPSSPAAWLMSRNAWVFAKPGESYAFTGSTADRGDVYFRSQAGKTYVVDCSVRRSNLSGAATFAYAIVRNEQVILSEGEVKSSDDHVVVAVAPGPAALMHLVFGPKDATYGWIWYGCDVTPAG